MATFYNQATLTYNGITKSSNITVGEITDVLSAGKTAARDTYSPGDSIVYVVNMANSGSAAISGITVTDDLGGYEYEGKTLAPLTFVEGSLLYYVNGELRNAPEVTSTEPLTVSGIDLPASGSAMIIYETKVNGFAPPETGGTITNNAVISAEARTTLAVVTETITAAQISQLDISKAVEPLTVEENGIVTYTFVIENTGNTPAGASDNAVITDVFSPALEDIAVTYEGESWTQGVEYTYDEPTGTFVTAEGQITVPAAKFTQNAQGNYVTVPGTATLTVSGRLVLVAQQ